MRYPPRRSGRDIACIALAVTALASGCVSLRPQDDRRVEIAKEAVQVAQELRQPESDPFAAMEANVDAVFEAWEKVNAIQTRDRQDTFYAVLPNMTRDDLYGRVQSTLDLHLEILGQADREVRQAAEDVEQQLRRQTMINKVLGAPTDSRLETVLEAVETRVAWLQGLQTDIARALLAIHQLDLESSNDEQVQKAQKLTGELGGNLEAVQDFVQKIQDDPQVAAAGQLLLRSGQEAAQAEQERLAQMRRFLKAVERKRDDLDRRNLLYFRSLMIPALAAVATVKQYNQALKVLREGTLARIKVRAQADAESSPPPVCPAPVGSTANHEVFCLAESLRADPTDQEGAGAVIAQALQARQQLWCPSCRLVDFVNASIDAQRQAAAPASATLGVDAMKNLVASVGILLFVEEPADRKAALELAKERHLHSIQLSRINSQQRLDLVGQVAQALQIYFQGGLTPAEAAQAILLASQVLSLAFIGSQI